MEELFAFEVCLIGVVAIFCQIMSWYLRVPAILSLLMAGIVLGPVCNILNPDELFGELLFPLTSLAVALILFEGSLTLKFGEIKNQSKTLIQLITIGPVIVFIGVTAVAYYSGSLSFQASLLLGAIMIVSGPTVIKPLLQTIRPNDNISKLLYWDSIVLDPIGAVLVTVIAGYFLSFHEAKAISVVAWQFCIFTLFGFLYGVLNGLLLSEIIKRHLLPNMLENILVLNWVLAAFVSANFVLDESGLVAVTIMGITIANRKNTSIDSILDFKETISMLLLSALFIILAARIELAELIDVIPESFIVYFSLLLVIQPLKVFVSCWGSSLSWKEKFMLSWVCPRGIVAAALVSILAVKLHALGYIHAEELIPITFLLIVYSVTVPSLTAGYLARRLGVALPENNGVLMVGANVLAREIAKVLVKKDIPVIVADSSWENISHARLEEIPVYYGNVTSDNAERNLDLTGIGNLLTVTPDTALSTLSRLRYKHIFGKKCVYYLQTNEEKASGDRHLIAEKSRGQVFAGEQYCYEQLLEILHDGGVIKATTLSNTFTFEDYQQKHKDNFILLLRINKKNVLSFRDEKNHYSEGTMLISLFRRS